MKTNIKIALPKNRFNLNVTSRSDTWNYVAWSVYFLLLSHVVNPWKHKPIARVSSWPLETAYTPCVSSCAMQAHNGRLEVHGSLCLHPLVDPS